MYVDAWRGWAPYSAATAIDSEPTVCSNKPGQRFFVVKNSDNKYYVRETTHGGGSNASWKQFGGTTFSSPPTCVMQKPYPNSTNWFLLAGKGTDNTIYAAEGVEVAVSDGSPPANPTGSGFLGAVLWNQVSTTSFSGNNGRPALASNGSKVVLTYLNGNRVYARYRNLPYSSSSWLPAAGAQQGPLLPSGFSSTGIPAIVYQAGAVGKFLVMVRAVSGSEGTRVFWIYFNGTAFDSSWSGPSFIPYSIDSDLALEHDPNYDALTVYFRSGNEVIQTSVGNAGEIGAYSFYPLQTADPVVTLFGAPRVVYGGGLEQYRVVVVRGYDSSTPVPNRGLLFNDQGGAYQSPWPNDWF